MTIRRAKGNGLGKMIKALRKQARLTQSDLADLVGMARTSVTNIEAGRQILTEDTINSLADAMGYQVHITFRRKKDGTSSGNP